jgi:hypothetical protein
VLRLGGDGTFGGRGETFGRCRFVNDTIVRLGGSGDTPTSFRLFEGIESLEFHNNVIWREGASSLTFVRAVEAQWTHGVRVRASDNWVKSGFALNPVHLPTTISGATPGFSNLGAFDVAPANGSQ